MLSSIRKSDQQRVYADSIEKDPKEHYYCDFCGTETIHHKSKAQLRISHFKHKSQASDCPNNTKESQVHLRTKFDIYNHLKANWGNSFKALEVEKWICQKSIRPDIFLETKRGNKIAIEVQATILTVDEIEKRTVKYYNEDIAVMWILPFEKGRFWKYEKVIQGYREADSQWEYRYVDDVKLKEMELWLLKAYMGKLIFWDLKHLDSDSFINVQLSDYVSPDSNFWRDGEEHYYYGRTAKTKKTLDNIFYEIPFDMYSPKRLPSIQGKRNEYSIPKRYLMLPIKKPL